MLDLTLFILPSGTKRHDPEKTIHSFGNEIRAVNILDHVDVSSLVRTVKTQWYGHLFSCETLDPNLMAILPLYFQESVDFLVVFQKVISEELRTFKTPRFFRSYVEIIPNTLYPKGDIILRNRNVMEGWVISDARP